MIHHHWVFSKIHLQFSSSDAITCKHSLTAKYEVTCVSYNVPVMFMFRIAYPDRYHITTPSVGSKWPFLWWRWSKNWRPFTPALACQTTITLKTCIPGRNSIIYFCSTFPISFLTYEWFWWHWCQGLRGLTVPIIRDQKIKAIWGPLTVISDAEMRHNSICSSVRQGLGFCQYSSKIQVLHRQINIIIVVKNFWRGGVLSQAWRGCYRLFWNLSSVWEQMWSAKTYYRWEFLKRFLKVASQFLIFLS